MAGIRISYEVVAEEVRRLWERDGKCTPTTFVAEARDPESPVHDLFDWEHGGAVRFAYPRRWWNTQARKVLAWLTYVEHERCKREKH